MEYIDFRSDTVTKPSPKMLEAITKAELGDDGREGDPTVQKLEKMAAEKLGKEAGILVSSGTMGNLLALMSHCNHGDEVILGAQNHIFISEGGGGASLMGLSMRTIPNNGPSVDPELVDAAVRPNSAYSPNTGLICTENSHVASGGMVLSPDEMAAMGQVAIKHSLPLHMDGARVFNAVVYLGIDAKDLVKDVDTLSFCLSKGLSAPVGSVLVGSQEFIDKARWNRVKIGGTMRQAGIIAAPGIVAMEEMIPRLQEDHDNAKALAQGLNEIPGLSVDLDQVQTNIVFCDLDSPKFTMDRFAAAMEESGVGALPRDGRTIRLVTHYGIEAEDVERALEALRNILD